MRKARHGSPRLAPQDCVMCTCRDPERQRAEVQVAQAEGEQGLNADRQGGPISGGC